jgi:hypothetical protein
MGRIQCRQKRIANGKWRPRFGQPAQKTTAHRDKRQHPATRLALMEAQFSAGSRETAAAHEAAKRSNWPDVNARGQE